MQITYIQELRDAELSRELAHSTEDEQAKRMADLTRIAQAEAAKASTRKDRA